MTYFQSNLRHLKEVNGYTSKTVSDLTGIGLDMVKYWLRESNSTDVEPNTKQLKRISDTFLVSIDYLISEDFKKITENEMLANYYDVQNRLDN